MSTYYEYQDVKVMIAHRLMGLEGWTVYGYHPDNSDAMTDYWDPASWGGVAEKNGYILCVDVYGAEKPQEIRSYTYENFSYDKAIADKIEKLKQMTVERGASESEAESAKIMISRLQKKAESSQENKSKYVVEGIIPGHLANPPRCNWHIEKDGLIIEKGTGILKYAKVSNYYKYNRSKEEITEYETDKAAYRSKKLQSLMGQYREDVIDGIIERHMDEMEAKLTLIKSFENFINKLDTTCGGLLGEAEYTYEKKIVTKYRDTVCVQDTSTGEITEGQCFHVLRKFNYGINRGYVYRIHEKSCPDGKKLYCANKLNGKLTKECTGRADSANYWYIGRDTDERFRKWIESGAISWCELKTEKVPYEVEQVVKKPLGKKKSASAEPMDIAKPDELKGLHMEILEDTDTRTNEKIYLVKFKERLNREDYVRINRYINSVGGYYSRFKHAFLFKVDPAELMNGKDV